MPPLRKRSSAAAVLESRVLRLWGAGGSQVASRIADLIAEAGGVNVGISETAEAVEVRIEAAAADRAAVRGIERAVRKRLGDLVFGSGEATLEETVVKWCRRGKKTVAVAESCTGGLVAHLLTNVPGVSAHFLEAVVSYSYESKVRLLGVPRRLIERYGAVSREVALCMARGVRKGSGADLAVGVTGIAGPTGGTRRKPVGLVYAALSTPTGEAAERYLFTGDRAAIKRQAANAALRLLWLALKRGS